MKLMTKGYRYNKHYDLKWNNMYQSDIAYMNRKLTLILWYISILLLLMTLTGCCVGEQPNKDNSGPDLNSGESKDYIIPNVTIEKESNPIYEVKLVSPAIIDKVKTNSNSLDRVLKIGAGLMVGVSTPNTLYLNGNLHTDEYLLKNRDNFDYKDKITEHLISIVYGKDSSNNTLLVSEPDYMIWFNEGYISDDINTSLAYAREFNDLSTTAQFEDESVLKGDLKDNYANVPYRYYRITLTSRESLDTYKKDKYKSTKEELLKDQNGTLVGIIGPEYVYLWNGLEGQDRRYYILKALYWNMGIHGETTKEPDSFFYSKANSSATLSELDKDAIRLLYGGRITSGMNADSMRKALNINL